MNKKVLNELSFYEIRERFLQGCFDSDIDEHHDAMSELHNKLNDVRELIPLIDSGERNCQYTAVFIAAQEGDGATPIFEKIFNLIKSEWTEVRDEACDCFLNCTDNPAHYIELLTLLYDNERAIRLRVITIVFGLSKNMLLGMQKLASKNRSSEDFNLGMKISLEKYGSPSNSSFFNNKQKTFGKFAKICSYVRAYKEYGVTKELKFVIKMLQDQDIEEHYKIYFDSD